MKLASSFVCVAVVLSCLKRPEMRPPSVDDSGKVVTCSAKNSATAGGYMHTKCPGGLGLGTPNPGETPGGEETTNPEEPTEPDEPTDSGDGSDSVDGSDTDDTGDTDARENIADSHSLASITVRATCHADGCLYREGTNKYWLRCEVKGCRNALSLEASTDTGGQPKIRRRGQGSGIRNRDKVCGAGKTVADLSGGNIKLECRTDRSVHWSFSPKKATLTLRKDHLDGRYVCVSTSNSTNFSNARLSINAGECSDRNKFEMQLEFKW